MRTRTLIAVAVVVLAVAAALVWRHLAPTLPRAGLAETEFDCPHDPGTISLAGAQASIPEYNDCQEFINTTGDGYLERVGIYVRPGLQALPAPVTLSCTAGSPTAGSPLCLGAPVAVQTAVAVAVVRSWNAGTYEPLGIGTGWNCLYLESPPPGSTTLTAKMVPVASEAECQPGVRSTVGLVGTALVVMQYPQDDVPAAGRWGWDQKHDQQYVVMACPGGWCAIGGAGFEPSEYWEEETPADNVRGQPRFARRPGNDIQRLALKTGSGLAPGTGWGVAVPEKGAFLDQAGDFDGKWVHTASLAYTDARAKYELGLNLRKGKPATKMTKVELCGEQAVVGGSPAKRCGMSIFARYMFEHRCSVETVSNMRWIARITSHAGGGPVYRCVTRTAHDAAVPGTVRWRWVATDETIWSPCGPGCCRVNTDEF